MSKKLYFLIAIPLAAIIFLTGCERSAAQAPLQPTATTSNPFNVARPTNLSLVQQISTETAQALQTQPASSPNPLTPLPSPTPTLSFFITQTTPGALASPTVGFFGTPPTPTVRIIVPTATPGRPASYTLQPGEYPYCIARRFNVDPSELLSVNNLPSNPPPLQPGTVLQIPQSGNPFPGSRAWHPHPGTFTFGVTDPNVTTIYGVACYFGDLDPTAIAAANGLAAPYLIHTGQVLNIP